MKIKSEWGLIGRIENLLARTGAGSAPGLELGIGDDCALFDTCGEYGLITADISIEGVHFNLATAGPSDIGYRAMASNISDIASMGGTPAYAFISMGIPRGMDEKAVMAVYRGMISVCKKTGTVIAGGDTSASRVLIISIALYGKAGNGRVLTRKGAVSGDGIYVTGTLGDSRAGLELLQKRRAKKSHPFLTRRHLRPDLRLGESSVIAAETGAHSMIDVSDGLVSDLMHICKSSGTGFEIDADSLPVSAQLKRYCAETGRDHREYALYGGEDYELLFTAPGPGADTLEKIGASRIGTIRERGFHIILGGKKKAARIAGYDHFAGR